MFMAIFDFCAVQFELGPDIHFADGARQRFFWRRLGFSRTFKGQNSNYLPCASRYTINHQHQFPPAYHHVGCA